MITIEQMRDIKVGDCVKIVDEYVDGCSQNSDGLMDKYLGGVFVVISATDLRLKIDQSIFGDDRQWVFNRRCIDSVISCDAEDFDFDVNQESIIDSCMGV